MERPAATSSSTAASDRHGGHCRDREDEFEARIALLERALAAGGNADTAPRRMLTQLLEVVGAVHRHGYAVIPGLLDADRVEDLRHGLEPLLVQSATEFARLASAGPRPAFHVHNVLAKSRAADGIALDAIIRAAVGAIVGFDFTFHAGIIVTAHSPVCIQQTLHRDDASFYALPRPRMPLVLTAAIALDDFTAANGATRLAPGSCWWERERQPNDSGVVAVEMPVGSVLFWDGAVFHGGGANVTEDRPRRTLLLNYTRGWLRTQANQFLSVPRGVVLSLPAELQKDLGYARSLRALGECDGREPLAYLQAIERLGDGAQARLGPESVAS
jgi:ectoine hydroxylase-related dioxygenase (phytanoyl-CoA dioxygenase family)